jgi:predicted MFS family arabinose efflux permease
MPTLKRMDHPRYGQKLFLGAISVLLLGHVFLAVAHQTAFGLIGGLLLFFIGFNQLEAALPSLISKHVRPEIKGTATGIYSSLQFLGTFAGAAAGGAMAQHIGDTAIFWACVGVVCVWWVIAALGKNDVENGQHAA